VLRRGLQATGLCDAPGVPAEVLEMKTLEHLADFRLNVEQWLTGRVAQLRSERVTVERIAANARDEAETPGRRLAPRA
jgi:hypothetical protein